MAGPDEPVREPAADPAPLSPHDRGRMRLCRALIYVAAAVTAAISVAIAILLESRIGRAGPSAYLWMAFGVNALLASVGGAAAVITLWPVARERWPRAAACIVFCPILHLGAVVAFAVTAGCLGLIH